MDLFPIFLKLEGRRSLVVGAGAISEEKIRGLLRGGAEVRVVAPQATPRVRGWARAGKILWDVRAFRPADLIGAFLSSQRLPLRHCTKRSTGRRGDAESCATSWTIPRTVTSITPR
jgi:hypothetical protein